MNNKTRQTFIVEYIFLTTLLEADLFILFLLLSWYNISHWHIKEAQTTAVAYSYVKSAKQCLPKDKLSSFISSFSKQITSHKLCQILLHIWCSALRLLLLPAQWNPNSWQAHNMVTRKCSLEPPTWTQHLYCNKQKGKQRKCENKIPAVARE